MTDEEIKAFNEAEQRIIDSCTKTITLYKKEYVEKLEKENEKLNHYKLLYQKVKERNDKAVEYIYNNSIPTSFSNPPLQLDFEGNIKDLLKKLEGNNEE